MTLQPIFDVADARFCHAAGFDGIQGRHVVDLAHWHGPQPWVCAHCRQPVVDAFNGGFRLAFYLIEEDPEP